jgi:hypothetical protein
MTTARIHAMRKYVGGTEEVTSACIKMLEEGLQDINSGKDNSASARSFLQVVSWLKENDVIRSDKEVLTKQFVALTGEAFDGDVEAQRCVMAYHSWFKDASKMAALISIFGGL